MRKITICSWFRNYLNKFKKKMAMDQNTKHTTGIAIAKTLYIQQTYSPLPWTIRIITFCLGNTDIIYSFLLHLHCKQGIGTF